MCQFFGPLTELCQLEILETKTEMTNRRLNTENRTNPSSPLHQTTIKGTTGDPLPMTIPAGGKE